MSIEKASVALLTTNFFAFSCSFAKQNCMLRRLVVLLKTAMLHFLFKIFFYADEEVEELFLLLGGEVGIEGLD